MSSANTEAHGPSTTGRRDQTRTKTRARKDNPAMRFAFYGCAPQRSLTGQPAHIFKEAQLSNARQVVKSCGGKIVSGYFDTYNRHWTAGNPPETHLPWGQRPQARALIDALTTDTFDAVVIGDLTAVTFGTTSVWDVVELLRQHDKQLWMPCNQEPLNPDDVVHVLLVKVLIGLPDPQPRGPQRQRAS